MHGVYFLLVAEFNHVRCFLWLENIVAQLGIKVSTENEFHFTLISFFWITVTKAILIIY